MAAPSRPLLRWLGGKFRLRDWIIEQLPPHHVYVEPFGGAFSVGLAKPRSKREVWNDLDDELVNLFQVLRSDQAPLLLRLLALTPYAEKEYRLAFTRCEDSVERARRAVVRGHMAHGAGHGRFDRRTGFRSDGKAGATNTAGEWAGLPEAMAVMVERIRGVTLRSEPATDIVREFNAERCLIYLDPPYVPEVRVATDSGPAGRYETYTHEMTADDHDELIDACRASDAMIVLSGYPSERYNRGLAGWEVRQTRSRTHRNAVRTEQVWVNPAAAAAQRSPRLFTETAG